MKSINFNAKATVSAAILLGILICIQSGCASLSPFGAGEIPVTEPDASTQCMVRMTSKFGQTKVEHLPINDQMTVQTVLESTGAIADYRTMEINIFRPVEGQGQMLRLPVEYDATQNHTMQECNYSIHPGDVITIQPKKNSALDKFVNSVFGQ
ncbi:MAG: hypothetical protein VYE64_02240 [Planctomycetota bacterium]|jgi:hypothetical protein|nr:hypothetical protein [Planctomycetota bacterium]